MVKPKKVLARRRLNPIQSLSSGHLTFFVLVLALFGTWAIYFASASPIPGEYGSIETDQLNRINNARAAAGVQPVTLAHIECIRDIAVSWTQYMMSTGTLIHNPNYVTQSSVITSYCGGSWSFLAENIGVGYESASLFNSFMNSSAHRGDILSPNATRVGIGAFYGVDGRLWVTQDFANCSNCGGGWNTAASPPADPVAAKQPYYYLRNSNTGGNSDVPAFAYGNPGDVPILCKWGTQTKATVGVFRNGTWYIRSSNTSGTSTMQFNYGAPGDIPLCGDWDHNGTGTAGVYRPSNQTFYLSNNNGSVAYIVHFGDYGDMPIAGDWDGDGYTSVGLYRPSNATFYLTNSNTAYPGAQYAFRYGNGSGDKPVAGDWDGNGKSSIGIWRSGTFYLADTLGGGANYNFRYGNSTDIPLAGDWDGNGTATVGIMRLQ